ncbi:hypothetical protein [Pseudomonas sp. BN515]|uniref:hypothetical protein n=1 Tax=Pseudomonas sp. BN515 TaxID=2567892 RepID=UPI00245776DB|nr:hypothetical protein [Pseudomonas sp. BN515]MDH4870628.1 hypothetical protein [Pseudomonas sp. BN515]
MDIKETLALLSCVLLVLCGYTYGAKFVRRGNYLLGFEWMIVAFSGSNLLIWMLIQADLPGLAKINYSISYFLDAFSRGFGIPIVAVLGLMAVTHSFKPSAFKDALIFVVTFAATFVLIKADFMVKPLPYYYVSMWGIYTLYLAYFIWKLAGVGEKWHALGVTVGAALGLMVACIYDFFPIPGDETKMVFLTIALVSWSYMMVQLYYSYFAFERAKAVRIR